MGFALIRKLRRKDSEWRPRSRWRWAIAWRPGDDYRLLGDRETLIQAANEVLVKRGNSTREET